MILYVYHKELFRDAENIVSYAAEYGNELPDLFDLFIIIGTVRQTFVLCDYFFN